MKTISEILKDKVSNGYVALRVEEKSGEKIRQVISKYNVSGLINDLHMTLMFDETEPNIKLNSSGIKHNCKVVDIKMLGEHTSDWYAVVLVISSSTISKRFKELQDLGYTHSHDEFIAHVSIKYKPSEKDTKNILDNKKAIIKELEYLVLGDEYSESINKPDPKDA